MVVSAKLLRVARPQAPTGPQRVPRGLSNSSYSLAIRCAQYFFAAPMIVCTGRRFFYTRRAALVVRNGPSVMDMLRARE